MFINTQRDGIRINATAEDAAMQHVSFLKFILSYWHLITLQTNASPTVTATGTATNKATGLTTRAVEATPAIGRSAGAGEASTYRRKRSGEVG